MTSRSPMVGGVPYVYRSIKVRGVSLHQGLRVPITRRDAPNINTRQSPPTSYPCVVVLPLGSRRPTPVTTDDVYKWGREGCPVDVVRVSYTDFLIICISPSVPRGSCTTPSPVLWGFTLLSSSLIRWVYREKSYN